VWVYTDTYTFLCGSVRPSWEPFLKKETNKQGKKIEKQNKTRKNKTGERRKKIWNKIGSKVISVSSLLFFLWILSYFSSSFCCLALHCDSTSNAVVKDRGAKWSWSTWLTSAHVSTVKVSLCFNWVRHHESVLGSGGIAPRILDLGTRWRWVVSLTTRPLYTRNKSPRYPLDRKLCGPQSLSGRGDEKSPVTASAENLTPVFQSVTQ